jgi:SAM-dependent methyltransferase
MMTQLGSQIYPPAGAEFLIAATDALVEQQFDIAGQIVNARLAGRCDVSFGITDAGELPIASVIWGVTSKCSSRLSFSKYLFSAGHSRQIIRTMLMALPLVAEYHAGGAPHLGTVHVNLDDNGTRPGISFCASSEEPLLIPDVAFMDNRGYQEMRDHFAHHHIPWEARKPVAFFRGGTSGLSHSGVWRDLPRAQLCLLASRPEVAELFDVGLSHIAQITDEQSICEIQTSGLMRDFVPAVNWNRCRFQIDIDGNTNAFVGFYTRLLTGSAVLKVASPQGFRQWYYGRLVPWRHYVPVAPDMSDLVDKVRWLTSHDESARIIGDAGSDLARSLEYQVEMRSAVTAVTAYMGRNASRHMGILCESSHPHSGRRVEMDHQKASVEHSMGGEYRPISEFVRKCLQCDDVLEVGFRGSRVNAAPIVPWAIGLDLDFPGYDGVHLPFEDRSQDTIFASHCLEHIEDYTGALSDWYRALKVGGHLIIMVPHQHLYERKAAPPSRFTGDHKRFYTPRSVLMEIDEALPLGGWRLRVLRDVDLDFDYSIGPEEHAKGMCEIEVVIQKITPPPYTPALVERPATKMVVDLFASLVFLGIQAARQSDTQAMNEAQTALMEMPLPPYRRLAVALRKFNVQMGEVVSLLRPVVAAVSFDEVWYLSKYGDIRDAVTNNRLESGRAHFVSGAYFEGRLPGPVNPVFE